MNVLIIGGGQIGTYMANLLVKNKIDITIVEKDRLTVQRLKERFGEDNVVLGNGSSPTILESAGIDKANVVAAVTGQDEVNLVVSTIAKFEFQAPRVVAKVNNPRNAWLFTIGMGVDAAVNQADIIGHMVVEEMSMKSLLTLMRLSRGAYSIIQLTVGEQAPVIGKAVKEIKIPGDALMIAIYRGDSMIVPHGATILFPGDKILFFSNEKDHLQLNSLFGVPTL